MALLKHYDRPVLNASGEAIPAYAVMQVSGWINNNAGKDVFLVKKPDANGQFYLLNGPFTIANKMGWGTRQNGVHALYDPALTTTDLFPADGTLAELGPVKDQWHFGKAASGWLVIGDVQGSGSTSRVRVGITSAAAIGGLRLGGGLTTSMQLAFIVKEIPARRKSFTYSADEVTAVQVTGGVSLTDAVVPLVIDKDTLEFEHDTWPDSHPTKAGQIKIIKGKNHCWDYAIFAGNDRDLTGGYFNDPPVWALGFISVDENDPFLQTFHIIDIINPPAIIAGQTTGPVVAGASIYIDNAVVRWGLKHRATKFDAIGNPDNWDSADNAYALIMRSVVTGGWVAIDLACPVE